jgi:exopolyphosphatase / guanosine-5'-triphosphate,3'-diphosphate pyrophosphatase
MRCACIDIGTNTTRLLVAEAAPGGLREVVSVRRFLSLAGGADGAIGAEAAARVSDVVAEHVRRAREHGAQAIRVVATAAVRDAPNGRALCGAVRRTAGLEVEVLSGEEEAALAFAGATGTLGAGAPDGLLGVVDIGGGSSELVTGTVAGGVTWWASLALGSGLLAGRHLRSDPPAPAELEAVRAEVAAALAAVDPPRPRAALVVGGSATALVRAAGGELSPQVIDRALALLAREPSAEAARRLGVPVERARLLSAGLLLLVGAWKAFGGVPLRLAGGGLREGVVLQSLSRDS